MKVALLSTLVLFSCLLCISAAPVFPFDDDDLDLDFSFPDISVDCSKLGCPSGSTACSKRTSTTQDKQLIKEEIKCYDSNGQETKSEEKSVQNPHPSSIQSGYEFYGSYNGGSQTIHSGNNQNKNDNVEVFNK